ncbi:hypothetical protein FHG87_014218 [Trinorchestia longiramus]|nr:hypothetical protein FHG87_014218 [Trinorchestia longiramus]
MHVRKETIARVHREIGQLTLVCLSHGTKQHLEGGVYHGAVLYRQPPAFFSVSLLYPSHSLFLPLYPSHSLAIPFYPSHSLSITSSLCLSLSLSFVLTSSPSLSRFLPFLSLFLHPLSPLSLPLYRFFSLPHLYFFISSLYYFSLSTPLPIHHNHPYHHHHRPASPDPSFLQVFRTSSRSSSRAGSVGRRGGSGLDSVADGGRLTHHRKEYTSPDHSVRTVADTYQYDSGDTHPSGNFQKKVVKSTYSSYNVDGGLTSELDSLKRGPTEMEMERALSQESRNILNSTTFTSKSSDANRVVDASQVVANELVGALSCIGSDSESEERNQQLRTQQFQQQQQHSQQQIMRKQIITQTKGSSHQRSDGNLVFDEPLRPALKISETDRKHRSASADDILRNGSSNGDYSTIGRLRKNIRELSSMIDDIDNEELEKLNKKYLIQASTVREMDSRRARSETNLLEATEEARREGRDGRSLSNGHFDDEMIVNDEKGGEVRRIVWRNRYEKTYETNDSTAPTISIEKDALNRRYNSTDANEATTISSLTRPHVPPQVSLKPVYSLTRPHVPLEVSLTRPYVPLERGSQSPKQLTLQYAVYWPGCPGISPGGQSWAEPVPLPTPPQISPNREPGVAYIYNYGSSGGSTVQPLPPLNYVSVAPPAGDSAPSPTPSNTTGQPVIYHYSYHYTIQPGQTLPEGAHPPSSPPTLQIAPPPVSGFSSHSTNINKSSTLNEVHHVTNRDTRHHVTTTKTINERPIGRDPLDSGYPSDGKPGYPGDGKPGYPGDGKPGYPGDGKPGYPGDGKPGYPGDGKPGYPGDGKPGYPRDGKPGYPGDGKPGDGKPGPTSVNYSVNSSNYHTETHHHPFPTGPGDKGPSGPPYDDRDKPNDPNRNITININKTTTHTTRTTRDGDYPGGDQPLTSTPYRGRSRSPDRRYPPEPRYPSGPSDSLERVRRTKEPGMPFPDTSPVKSVGEQRLPRRVDDLLSEFPVKNGGPHRMGYNAHPDSEPLLSTDSRQTREEITLPPPERNEINTMSPLRLREEREKTKNLAGPPVYYPPGHEAFSESMHTMTLKEGGRRGKAKWRREAASGYKESASHSESKGEMKMVPLCLPLCCGAACTIM